MTEMLEGGGGVEQAEYRVERGVPLPKKHGHPKFPLRKMRVGDSFVVPVEQHRAVITAASRAGKRHGRKYTTRLSQDLAGKVVGVRVWRTA